MLLMSTAIISEVVGRGAPTLSLSPEELRAIVAGFLDHRTFRLEDYQSDMDTLVVEDAGRDLYLV